MEEGKKYFLTHKGAQPGYFIDGCYYEAGCFCGQLDNEGNFLYWGAIRQGEDWGNPAGKKIGNTLIRHKDGLIFTLTVAG